MGQQCSVCNQATNNKGNLDITDQDQSAQANSNSQNVTLKGNSSQRAPKPGESSDAQRNDLSQNADALLSEQDPAVVKKTYLPQDVDPHVAVPIDQEPKIMNLSVIAAMKQLNPLKLTENEKLDQYQPYKLLQTEEIYIGTWRKSKREGCGKNYWPDGRQYEGQWKGDVIEGYGRKIESDGTIHEGYFVDGVPHGKGILTKPDQSKYEGDFVRGRKEGIGTETYATGIIYKGQFKDDKMHGEGEYTIEKKFTYVGSFKND